MACGIKNKFCLAVAGLAILSDFGAAANAQADLQSAASPQGSKWSLGAQGADAALSLRVPFIMNRGQIADPQLLFFARTFGGTVYVTAGGELLYALPKGDGSQPTANSQQPSAVPQMAVIREIMVDADPIGLPAGAERSGVIVNSFIGNDPRRWQAGIPAFDGVRFGEIYEGISLEVRAAGNNVEKIFTVAPGADPARIAMRLQGAEGLVITPEGELEARTALGPVRFSAPVAYQWSAAGTRERVPVVYALEGDQVGFCVGAYDAARPLVIDPLLASTFIGGTQKNVIRAMALDSQTNVLAAGYTASTDFPTTNSPYQPDNRGLYDAFIAKFDPMFTNLLAATYLGGSGDDAIQAMAINSGLIYVAGYTASTNFPIQSALYSNYNGGAYDAFVTVLDGDLTNLTSSTYLGGTNADQANALAFNAAGEVYVAGYTASINFPTNNTYSTSFQTGLAGSNDAFVTKFDAVLSANLASTYIGGSSNDQAFSISVDTNDFVYIAGITASADFPATNGFKTTSGGSNDAFVTKLSGLLTNVAASTYLGGLGNESANSIAVAPFTNIVCVVGYTDSGNFPQNPTNNIIAVGYTNQYMGGKDAFLTRLDLNLTNVLASTYIGGSNDDEAAMVLTYATGATNNSLRIYVAGYTASSNFPVTTNAYDTTANGGKDAFISYWGTGTTLRASTYLGGSNDDTAYALALQADTFALFVAGSTASSNFPVSLRAYEPSRTGHTSDDGFVTRLGSGLAYGSLKWQVVLRDPDDAAAVAGSPSLGWDGTVYCGFGSNLYAFDALGRQRWVVKASGVLELSAVGEVYALGSIPAVATNGTIYVTSSKVLTQPGYLQAISPEGAVNWTFTTDSGANFSSPAIGNNGTIYFGTYLGNFYAVKTNGGGLWTNALGGTCYASPAIATNGNIFVANASQPGILYSFRTNGSVSNTWQLRGPTYSSPTIGTNGMVYIGSSNNLFAFKPGSSQTQRIWNAGGQIYAAPTISSNGIIYVGGGTNLYAFNADSTNAYGTTNRFWTLRGTIKSSATVDTNGNVIVGAFSAFGYYYLYSLNPVNGATNWALQVDEEIHYHSPLVQRDGTIYMTDQYNIYSIFGPAATPRTNWPTARHNVLRTGNAAFDAARLLKPTGLTVSKGTYFDRVLVSWNGNANAEYYEIFRNVTNNLATAQYLGTALTANFTDATFEYGKIYYYWVRVFTPVAMSDFSDSDSGGVPPCVPTGVTATKGNPTNAIVITWAASSNATTYSLYHSSITNDTNTAVWLATTSATGYTNSPPNMTRGITYWYWVKAGNGAAGESDFSYGDGYTNSGGTPPLPPFTITADKGVTHVAVDVAWSVSTGAPPVMYAVYRGTNDIPPSDFMIVTNGLTLADTNTAPFLNYYYWVRATNQYGLGEFSGYDWGYRILAPPPAIYATRGAFPNKIRVSWQIELSATSYLVWRNTIDDPGTAEFRIEMPYTDPAATNYDELSITRGMGYYFWVQSKNEYGTSIFSQVAEGGTVPYPPGNVQATGGSDFTQVTVTWDPTDFTTAYEVYRLNTYDPWSLTAPLGISYGTMYNDLQARPGERYYYWIKATNVFGPSELSGFSIGWRILAAPYSISASDGVSTGHLYVIWSATDNASSYELWRGTNNTRSAALVRNNAVTTNAYDDTESTPGVTYFYWVRAKTAEFISEFSPYDSGYRALGQVDIGVSDLVFLPNTMKAGGAPSIVSFRVTNYGQYSMVDPNAWVSCNFYISTNAVYNDADAEWMGGTTLSIPVAVTNNVVESLSKAICAALTVPSDIPLGLYYIYVNIQHALPSKWLDANQSNNKTSRNGGVIRIDRTQPATYHMINDFNGDGYTDFAMYQESTGTWQVWFFGNLGLVAAGRGGLGFEAVPADYDGDGKTDIAVYQEATGTWEVWLSSADNAMAIAGSWGGPGFDPVPADYDGDRRADPAVYQESTGTWRAWLSSVNYSTASAQGAGGLGFRPAPGDYDGDGKADPAVYQEPTGTWKIWRSSLRYALVSAWGMGGNGYRPVQADYDYDGITDPAVFQESTGAWRVWLSASRYSMAGAQGMGGTGTVAVPGDYDGDGKTDPAIYWDSFGLWRLWLSGSGYQQVDFPAWPGDGYRPVWR